MKVRSHPGQKEEFSKHRSQMFSHEPVSGLDMCTELCGNEAFESSRKVKKNNLKNKT